MLLNLNRQILEILEQTCMGTFTAKGAKIINKKTAMESLKSLLRNVNYINYFSR